MATIWKPFPKDDPEICHTTLTLHVKGGVSLATYERDQAFDSGLE